MVCKLYKHRHIQIFATVKNLIFTSVSFFLLDLLLNVIAYQNVTGKELWMKKQTHTISIEDVLVTQIHHCHYNDLMTSGTHQAAMIIKIML